MRDEIDEITEHLDALKQTHEFYLETIGMTDEEREKALFIALLGGRNIQPEMRHLKKFNCLFEKDRA